MSNELKNVDLEKLKIAVTYPARARKDIITNFSDLDDAIEACVSSSQIPLISGPLISKRNGMWVVDGAFNGLPEEKSMQSKLTVSHGMFGNPLKRNLSPKRLIECKSMYDAGYSDAFDNHDFLLSSLR